MLRNLGSLSRKVRPNNKIQVAAFSSQHKFETIQLHAGQPHEGDPGSKARAVPIVASTSFLFDSPEHAKNLFSLQEFGNIYSRIMNPTNDAFEQRIAALEGGAMAVSTSSGQSAQLLAMGMICKKGDNFVSSPNLYGGSVNQFKNFFPRFAIDVNFAAEETAEAYEALIDENTKAIYVESLPNPSGAIPDFKGLAAVAQKHKIPFVVDNTFGCGGYIINPIEHGANVILHSCTKWIGGHGTTIGGVVIDAGNFDWGSGKFPEFTDPNPNYHGMKMWDTFGPDGPLGANVCFAIRCRVEGLRDLGMCQNPFGSFLLLQGLETLSLRTERHCDNTLAMAKWLTKQPEVEWVNFVGLPDHPFHDRAQEYFRKNHYGCVLNFGVKGGRQASEKFIKNVQLLSHLANIGDAKSLVIHPASTTHGQLSDSELVACGVPADLVRFSVGIEHLDDIKADVKQALKKAVKA